MRIIARLIVTVISIFLVNISLTTHANASFKFPWQANQSWQWLQGWHYESLDLGLDSENDEYIVAMEDGIVKATCDDGRSSFVEIEHIGGVRLRYLHTDSGALSSEISIGKTVKQGQILGRLKKGTWSDINCGYANQINTTQHIHLTFLNQSSLIVDGWNFSKYTDSVVNNNVTKNVYDWFESTNSQDVEYCGGTNVLISNKVITSALSCSATNQITIKPETQMFTGSNVRLYIN